jgi:SAM-dependent methyltransferase
MDPRARALLDAAAQPYAAAGRHAFHFVRGKLRHDPVYSFMLRLGLLPDRGRLLDVGCGRGLLLALLRAARESYRAGTWPRGWAAPPLDLDLAGIDLRADHVLIARAALGGDAGLEARDLRDFDFPPSTAIVMLDVLLYLREDEQQRALAKAAAALASGGVLLLREADAGAGVAYGMSHLSERLLEALRGRPFARLRYRRAAEWAGLLESLGFTVAMEPMSEGTPFANVLFVCTKSKGRGMKDEG